MDIVRTLQAAAPLGGAVALGAAVLAAVVQILRLSYRTRETALRRANKADIPRILGDEIDKLKLDVSGLNSDDRFFLVAETLRQREQRNQRVFKLATTISIAMFVLLAMLIIIPALSSPGVSPAPANVRTSEPPNQFAAVDAGPQVIPNPKNQGIASPEKTDANDEDSLVSGKSGTGVPSETPRPPVK